LRPSPLLAINHLLEALPTGENRRFVAACELVSLDFAEVLAEPGERMRYVYFPTQGFISLLTRSDACSSLEVGLVGFEGMLGMSLILEVDVSPLRALVQGPGAALRMETAQFRHQLGLSPALKVQLQRYLYVTIGQLAQTAACTRFHLVEARLARWLLMTQDRAQSDSFHITHELLARMLGVRRVGVTKAASSLQHRQLIRYSRGDIKILDRAKLVAASCRCYAADKTSYDQMFGEARGQR
jgi:CRP-like cAMP-binding protein